MQIGLIMVINIYNLVVLSVLCFYSLQLHARVDSTSSAENEIKQHRMLENLGFYGALEEFTKLMQLKTDQNIAIVTSKFQGFSERKNAIAEQMEKTTAAALNFELKLKEHLRSGQIDQNMFDKIGNDFKKRAEAIKTSETEREQKVWDSQEKESVEKELGDKEPQTAEGSTHTPD